MITGMIMGLVGLALWLWAERRERIAAIERVEALESLFASDGAPGGRLMSLERRLNGLRSDWRHSSIPLSFIVDGLVGFELGMTQAQVEAKILERPNSELVVNHDDQEGLSYFYGPIPWLDTEWGVNLTIRGGRLLEVFVANSARSNRSKLDAGLQAKLGQPLETKPPDEAFKDPRFAALVNSPTLRDRKSWAVPVGGVNVSATAMGDDANAAVRIAIQ